MCIKGDKKENNKELKLKTKKSIDHKLNLRIISTFLHMFPFNISNKISAVIVINCKTFSEKCVLKLHYFSMLKEFEC